MMKLNHLYTLEGQKGAISPTGTRLIIRLLQNQDLTQDEWAILNPTMTARFLNPLPKTWQWVWMFTDGKYRGSFPKRVRSYYKKAHGIKCPNPLITKLGNIARRHTEESPSYKFMIVNEFDWQAGDFGDGSSCYWTDNEDARYMLWDNDARAICFFDNDGKGYARAWLVEVEDDDFFIVFNGYGFPNDSTHTIARIFAQWQDLPFHSIGLYNNLDSAGMLYINGGIGYAIGHTNIQTFDFGWYVPKGCYYCGTELGDYNCYLGADGNDYCEDCYSDMFDACDKCGETFEVDDMHYGDVERLCYYCHREQPKPEPQAK